MGFLRSPREIDIFFILVYHDFGSFAVKNESYVERSGYQMQVECVSAEYRPGSRRLVQGIKDCDQYDHRLPDGSYFRSRSHGWGEVIVSSKFLLTVSVGGRLLDIDVIDFFHYEWERLTKNRQSSLIATVPNTVNVSLSGGTYRVDVADLDAWFDRAEKHNDSPEEKARRKVERAERLAEERREEEESERESRAFRRRMDRDLKKRRDQALKLAFQRRTNPRHGYEQWQVRHEGVLYVLDRFAKYDASEAAIPVEAIREIGVNIKLVKRI